MQLGTRWPVTTTPPSTLPDAVTAAIASVEAGLAGVDSSQWRWTLTYLESRPVVELDDGTVIRIAPNGTVSVTNLDDDTDSDD